jgi:hypothetical protein
MSSQTRSIVITAVISMVVTSALWVAGITVVGLAFFLASADDWPELEFVPPPFVVAVDGPRYAAPGEIIDLELEVFNPTDTQLEVSSIDVFNTFLNGFTVVQVKPKPEWDGAFDEFTSFYFSKRLAPGRSFKVLLRLQAAKTGIWTGDIDFCDPYEAWVSSSVTIRVREDVMLQEGEGESTDDHGNSSAPVPDQDP